MKILKKTGNEIQVKPESIDDLWVLSTCIFESDTVKGTTLRKVTIGDKSVEKAKVSKRPMFLAITVEKTEFTENSLRILGSITDGPEDVARGEHHSFVLEPNQDITIVKEWPKYQIQQLEDAVNKKDTKILACLFNREEAIFGKLEQNSFRTIANIKGNVAKKQFDQLESNFFSEIIEQIKQQIENYEPEIIILGSPSFWQPTMKKEVDAADIKIKPIYTTVSEVTSTGFTELLQQKEVETALSNIDAGKNQQLIDTFFSKLSKDEPVVYGIKDCSEAGNSGAISELLCTDTYIRKKREESSFSELNELFLAVEGSQGKIHILSGKNDPAIRLDGIGGVAGILRFAIK